MPGRIPEPRDVERLVGSLIRSGRIARVLLNLSKLDYLSSLLLARFVAMNRQIRAAGGTLYLCGLHPVVREIFETVGLAKSFQIVDREEDALGTS
jgi:anti-anti-sigma factor